MSLLVCYTYTYIYILYLVCIIYNIYIHIYHVMKVTVNTEFYFNFVNILFYMQDHS